MTVKKLLSIVTIGTVVVASAVGIGIGLKSINSTPGKEAFHVDRPGSDYVKVFDDEDKGKQAYYVNDNVEFQIIFDHFFKISSKGWMHWFHLDELHWSKTKEAEFTDDVWADPLIKYAKEHGKTKKSWSWYRENISGGDKLPPEFYFDLHTEFDGAFTRITALWMPETWFEHDEETEENVHYDALVSLPH